MNKTNKNLEIDAGLHARISIIADQRGKTAEQLISEILTDQADAIEADTVERVHLEHRWQKYLESGETVSAEKIQTKLRQYAAEAARRMES